MTLAFYTPLSIVYTFWIMIYFLSILGLWFSENSSLIFKFYQDSFFHLFN